MARLTRKRLDNLRRFLSVLTARHTRRFPRTDTRTITTSTSVRSQNETNSFICNKSKRNHPQALMINKILHILQNVTQVTIQRKASLSSLWLSITPTEYPLGIISHTDTQALPFLGSCRSQKMNGRIYESSLQSPAASRHPRPPVPLPA